MAKPTIKLWSTEKGKLAIFRLEADQNGEVVAIRADNNGSDMDEFVKFPAGLTKAKFLKLVEVHNKSNKDVKALSRKEIQANAERKQLTEELLETLNK